MKFRSVFFILMIIVIVVMVIAVVDYYELAWWVGGALLGITLGVMLLFILIKRYISRKKDQSFIRRLIKQSDQIQDNHSIENKKKNLSYLFHKGFDQFKQSINTTSNKKNSYLLPWFLFIAQDEEGQAIMLDNATLNTSLTDVEFNKKNHNLNWWFFKTIVALTLSKRYVRPSSDNAIENEWHYFLELLHTNRVKEPINGIVLTISTKSLLTKSHKELINEAHFIRKRLNQIIKTIGATIPIYIMVTKLDLLLGCNELLESIPSSLHHKSLGSINENFTPTSNEEIELFTSDLLRRIQTLFDTMIQSSLTQRDNAFSNLHLLSHEINQMTPALGEYIKTLFAYNPYDITPKFRGLYFSSAKQTGKVESNFYDTYFNALPITPPQTSHSYFIDDFIERILPHDRYKFNYLHPVKSNTNLFKRLSSLIVLVIGISITTLGLFSYQQNRTMIDHASKFKPPTLSNHLNITIHSLYQSAAFIHSLEKSMDKQFLHPIGFPHSMKALETIQSTFREHFHHTVLTSLDNTFSALTNKNRRLNRNEYTILMSYLIHSIRINDSLINHRKPIVSDSFKPIINDMLKLHKISSDDIAYKYRFVFNQYIHDSHHDIGTLQQRNIKLKHQFKELFSLKRDLFDWLTSYTMSTVDPITVDSFLQGFIYKKTSPYPSILGAYTQKGHDIIKKHMLTIESILPEEKEYINQFWSFYHQHFIRSWEQFLKAFPTAVRTNHLPPSHHSHSFLTMTSPNNSYSQLLQRAHNELNVYHDHEWAPWIQQLNYLVEYLNLAKNQQHTTKNNQTLITSLTNRVDTAQTKISKRHTQKLNDAIMLSDYYHSLERVSFLDIHDDLKQFFLHKKGPSKLKESYELLNRFLFSIKHNVNETFLLRFIQAPFDFIIQYAMDEESCRINEEWRSRVVTQTKEYTTTQKVKKLFNQQTGYTKPFIDTHLSPYLSHSINSYKIKTLYETYRMPFKPSFLPFINHGSTLIQTQKESYRINLSTRPISVNKQSHIKPYRASLTVNCLDNNVTMKNFNFKDRKSFQWSQENCGDTRLTIDFKDFSLIKDYKGNFGFLHFLKEITKKNKVFTHKDFSHYQTVLKEYNIQWIDIGYKASGELSWALNLLDPLSQTIPQDVMECRH